VLIVKPKIKRLKVKSKLFEKCSNSNHQINMESIFDYAVLKKIEKLKQEVRARYSISNVYDWAPLPQRDR